MVSIPTAEGSGLGNQQTSKVADNFQNFSISDDQFGARQGRAMQNLGSQAGQVITRFAAEHKEAEDTARTYEEFQRANDQVRVLSQAGLSTQGSSSVGITRLGTTEIDKIYQESIGNLKNEDQVRKFESLFRVKREGALDILSKHEARSLRDYKVQSLQGTIAQSKSDAVATFTNPKVMALNIYQGEEALREMHGGKPPEFVENEVLKYRSDIHEQVVNRFLQNDPITAQLYYDQNKEDIVGGKQADIEGRLKIGVRREAGRAQSESIISAGGGIEDWRKQANKIKDVDLFDEVSKRLDKRHRQIEQADKARSKDLTDSTWKQLIDGGNTDNIDTATWSALPAATQKTMIAYEERRSNKVNKTDLRTWSDLEDQALSDPKAFAERDLFQDINKLSELDFKKFSDMQRDVLTGGTGSMKQLRSWKSMADGALNEVGIEKKESGRLVNMFQRKLSEEIEDYQRVNNRDPNTSEVQDIIDTLLIQGTSDPDGLFNSRDAYFFEDAEGFELPDEPPKEERRKILDAAFRLNKGADLSDDQIKIMYWRKLGFNENGKRIR